MSSTSNTLDISTLLQKHIAPYGKLINSIQDIFVVGKVLGEGSQAKVFKAQPQDTTSSEFKEVAIKSIPTNKLYTLKKWTRLEREISILLRCKHPSIMRLLGVYYTKTHIYLVNELCEGGELFDALIDAGYFAEDFCRYLMKSLGESVAYLHSRGIAHRDLKPENILLTEHYSKKPSLKLCDFGYAKEVSRDPMRQSSVGSPGYAAPEVFGEQPYSLDVDMFSIGVILYTMLVGFPPFWVEDDNEDKLLELAGQAEFEFPSPWFDDISATAKDLIRKTITKSGQPRLSAKAFLLHPWMKGKVHMPPPSPTSTASPLATHVISAVSDTTTPTPTTSTSSDSSINASAEEARRQRFITSDISLRKSLLALDAIDAIRTSEPTPPLVPFNSVDSSSGNIDDDRNYLPSSSSSSFSATSSDND